MARRRTRLQTSWDVPQVSGQSGQPASQRMPKPPGMWQSYYDSHYGPTRIGRGRGRGGLTASDLSGFYDPTLDAQVGSVKRGYQDQLDAYHRDYGFDPNKPGGRAYEDYQINRGDVLTQGKNTYQDLLTSGRNLNQQYQTATGDLNRSYQNLGSAQTQRAAAMGSGLGGALIQAARKRAMNQGLAQSKLDTAHNQQAAGLLTQTVRDFGAGSPDFNAGHMGGSFGEQLAKLSTNLTRNFSDATTNLAHQGRETHQFGIDTQKARLYQAQLNGFPFPGKKRRSHGGKNK